MSLGVGVHRRAPDRNMKHITETDLLYMIWSFCFAVAVGWIANTYINLSPKTFIKIFSASEQFASVNSPEQFFVHAWKGLGLKTDLQYPGFQDFGEQHSPNPVDSMHGK